ncbi:hypothetical protein P7D22_20355 [Lichenihabitans sp. Uapishka_5]|uniref:hypothetical protein n=1 Tax=Lichenihabitans sp. Uapishka_5 TaxID=3037302 RepID=UPI0029E7F519|nr:hypothetical protein [Lichenihabitans sp. Uapishka_5]MDX7953521.1 hypothetical protein [Lichenihabitans sp. Uapishka_5]
MNEIANHAQFQSAHKLVWELSERRDEPGVWSVEAIGSDGEIYLVVFYEKSNSRELAEEYLAFKNAQ